MILCHLVWPAPKWKLGIMSMQWLSTFPYSQGDSAQIIRTEKTFLVAGWLTASQYHFKWDFQDRSWDLLLHTNGVFHQWATSHSPVHKINFRKISLPTRGLPWTPSCKVVLKIQQDSRKLKCHLGPLLTWKTNGAGEPEPENEELPW